MGFLFLVLYPPSSSASRPPLSLTHSHSLTLTHSHSLTLTHSHTHSLTHSPTHALTHSPLTHSLIHPLTHSLTQLTHTHSLTYSLTHPLTHSLTQQAWDNVHPSGVRWAPLLLRGRHVTMCTAKGSDVRPGVPLASLWRPSGVPWAPLLLRGRHGTMCTAKGSAVRPGVPLASLWRACGVPVASLWCPLGSAAFAWQGVGCTPWRPSGVPLVSLGLRCFCVAGVGQCALPRGRMYALASLWRPSGVPWAPLLLRGRRGTMCTAKGSDVRPGVPLAPLWCPLGSVAFAWQAWDNLAVPKQGMAIYQLSSFRFIACEFIMACFCMLRLLRS